VQIVRSYGYTFQPFLAIHTLKFDYNFTYVTLESVFFSFQRRLKIHGYLDQEGVLKIYFVIYMLTL